MRTFIWRNSSWRVLKAGNYQQMIPETTIPHLVLRKGLDSGAVFHRHNFSPRTPEFKAQEPVDVCYDCKYGIVIQISQLLLLAVFTVLRIEICVEVQGIKIGYWQTTEI